MRLLSLYCSAQSGDAAKSTFQNLQEENGNPIIIEQGMEEGAIDKLKRLEEQVNGR